MQYGKAENKEDLFCPLSDSALFFMNTLQDFAYTVQIIGATIDTVYLELWCFAVFCSSTSDHVSIYFDSATREIIVHMTFHLKAAHASTTSSSSTWHTVPDTAAFRPTASISPHVATIYLMCAQLLKHR